MEDPVKPYTPRGELRDAFEVAIDGIRSATVADWMWRVNQNSIKQKRTREKCKLTFVCQKKRRPKYAK